MQFLTCMQYIYFFLYSYYENYNILAFETFFVMGFSFSCIENYPQLGDKEWYFYTPRDRKYPNGKRPKRSVEGIGYWKATGADKLIQLKDELIGKKKVLVFYLGKPKSNEEKTNWIMHEYKLNTPSRSSSNNNMRV